MVNDLLIVAVVIVVVFGTVIFVVVVVAIVIFVVVLGWPFSSCLIQNRYTLTNPNAIRACRCGTATFVLKMRLLW